MKINPLKSPLNRNPEIPIEVSRVEYFKYFFKLLNLNSEDQLSNNELKVLSALCSNKELASTGITKNNLPPVLKKLNEKGYMEGKDLSPEIRQYKEKFDNSVEIVLNFKLVEDDSG